MNRTDLFRAFDGVDDDILERSDAPAPRWKAPTFQKWGILAACAALVVSLAGAAFAAEAKEYSAAVEFFEDNGLSLEGLSRADVKAVYRDIITQRFTYDKTAEVIEQAVLGVEIFQRQPTPEELAELWNRKDPRNDPSASPFAELDYRVEIFDKLDEELGFKVLDKWHLKHYEGGELVWRAEFDKFGPEGWSPVSEGTAVWGGTPTWSSEQTVYSWVARLDEAGTVLWERQLDHGFQNESIAAVLDNGDSTWAVISRGDFQYLCLSQYDTDGNELSFYKTEVGNLGIWNAAHLGDGYLIQLGNRTDGENGRLVKLDRDGRLLESFTYQGEDCDYYITGMIEFGGRVCLSAYAVPKQADEGGRHEIANILDYVFDNDLLDISNEELTPLVRDNYTAVLLLCGPEGGQPETFYSVKGSLGGELAVNDAGELVWDVESLVETFFSPATSSFTIYGTCQVFRYTFDSAGNLMRQEDTGETVQYHR